MSLAEGRAVVSAKLLRMIDAAHNDFNQCSDLIHAMGKEIHNKETFDMHREYIPDVEYSVSDAFDIARLSYIAVQEEKDTLPPRMVTKMMDLMGHLISSPDNEPDYTYPSELSTKMNAVATMKALSKAMTYVAFRVAMDKATNMIDMFASGWKDIYLIAQQYHTPSAGGYHKRSGIRKRSHRKRTHRKRTHRK